VRRRSPFVRSGDGGADGGITWTPVADGHDHQVEGRTCQVIGNLIVVFGVEAGHVEGGVAWIGTPG
jgi:hypothetical protein